MNQEVKGAVKSFTSVTDRILLLKLNAAPMNINIIQKEGAVVEEFYDNLETVMRQCKTSEITIVMCDFNAKVGKEIDLDMVGNFGLDIEMREETG